MKLINIGFGNDEYEERIIAVAGSLTQHRGEKPEPS